MRTEFVSNVHVHWRTQKAAAGHRCVPQKRAVKFRSAPLPPHFASVCDLGDGYENTSPIF